MITGDYLLTLHEERISLPAALALDLPEQGSRPHVVYAVLDAMLESAFDALEEVEQGLEGLERDRGRGPRRWRVSGGPAGEPAPGSRA